MRNLRRQNCLIDRNPTEEHLIDRAVQLPLVNSKPTRRVGLGVQIYEKNLLPREGQGGAQVDRGGCLAHPSFLVTNRNNFAHVPRGTLPFLLAFEGGPHLGRFGPPHPKQPLVLLRQNADGNRTPGDP